MSLAIRLAPEAARSLAFGSIGAAYMGVGTAFTEPIRLMILQNFTDASVWISFDGVNDHIPLTTLGYVVLDITANKTTGQGWFIAEGTRIYTKRLGTPTSGSVYVSTFFGAE